ncbi:MAG TPA: hypothetical protein PLN06_08540 [Bacteroidales bacterium]|nr:hypothetical protein [Bacteroidales bacterium]HQG37203.1 hypothetical protein [Bacteroidales bacterium]HQG53257.1 hypothetical protein [Bacteroidales bacterium]HQJ21365.1 hypothetical protein [Bacteroidales bacterium]
MSKENIRTLPLLLLYGFFVFCEFSCSEANKKKIQNERILYNGIVLPEKWPPRYSIPAQPQNMPVPYLESIPEIIPINVGRQLLMDDFLIETTNLKRTFHYPQYFKGNPVLEADRPWEYSLTGYPYAAPFSDGVWYDEKEKKFKLWYSTGGGEYNKQAGRFAAVTAFAVSADGVNWEKPALDIVPGTNLVDTLIRDSNTMWLDKNEQDSTKRYKLFNVQKNWPDLQWRLVLKYSSDGIHWSEGEAHSGDIHDRTTVFYNPFRGKWIFSARAMTRLGRSRNYLEHSDPETGVSLLHRAFGFIDKYNVFWFGPWENELRHPDPAYSAVKPSIYNLDAIAYESILLGFFSVWQGPENDICTKLRIQKRNEVAIGFSRDGFHWHRPDMNRFFPVDETAGAWNNGNIQSAVGVPLIVGDSLYFYMSGRKTCKSFWDACSGTGLAKLRRDGFASMDADSTERTLLTRKLTFDGRYLFVNADASQGYLYAEILNEDGKVMDGFSKQQCKPVRTDGTKLAIEWQGKKSLKNYSEIPVRIKFYLKKASLYSFWISKYPTGESEGFTGGGGPGLHPSGKDLPVRENEK